MKSNDELLDLIELLRRELQAQQLAQTVQTSAYLVLVSRLARLGLLAPKGLAADLRVMAQAQPAEGWQSGHELIASAVDLVGVAPELPAKAKRQRPM